MKELPENERSEYDGRHDTGVEWKQPSMETIDECRKILKERGITEEQLDRMYPRDKYIYMIKNCITKTELRKLQTSFERNNVDQKYIDMILDILTQE